MQTRSADGMHENQGYVKLAHEGTSGSAVSSYTPARNSLSAVNVSSGRS
jgi:hypothetical protein